jgi:hypothetical protein
MELLKSDIIVRVAVKERYLKWRRLDIQSDMFLHKKEYHSAYVESDL